MNINGTLVAQAIVFALLVLFTMKFVWPPIAKALDERALKISEGLASAEKAKSELAVANKRVEEELSKSRNESATRLADAERRAQSLIEEAKKGLDEEKAVAFAKKLKSGKGFDLNDFKEQIAQMRNMGGLSALMDKMPAQIAQAAGQLPAGAENKMVGRVEGIINSMTPAERAKPEIIKASRKRRIAMGAGVQVQEVNRLLNQFEQSQKMMKMMSKGGMSKLMRGMKGMMPGMGR